MAAAALAISGAPVFGERTDSGSGYWIKQSLDLDHNLVERCLSGDQAGWEEEMVRTHTRRVYGLCYRFTGKGRRGAGSHPGSVSARLPDAEDVQEQLKALLPPGWRA